MKDWQCNAMRKSVNEKKAGLMPAFFQPTELQITSKQQELMQQQELKQQGPKQPWQL
jgi:hypothetical protein